MTANRQAVAEEKARSRTYYQPENFPIFFASHRPNQGLGGYLDGPGVKRAFDIVFSALALTLGAPLYLLVAILVKLAASGPIFYAQTRVGRYGRRFVCVKFRTMIVDADQLLENIVSQNPALQQEFKNNFKLKQDPRITPLGRFMRMTSLDELPQFWNVLKGDMSVVGPRPLVPDELKRYGSAIHTVLEVKPGITGLWQVSGRNDIPYDRRIQIDVSYSRYHSFSMDLWILFKTVRVVLFPKGNGAY
ncbi:MAG: sugar transferase [Synechococcales cyanobacterium CRU_2_2]|nr:sugar transferase [Synechococcales cyanobacterium CRU_2_2]